MRITGIARVVSLGQVPSNLSTPAIYKALAETLELFYFMRIHWNSARGELGGKFKSCSRFFLSRPYKSSIKQIYPGDLFIETESPIRYDNVTFCLFAFHKGFLHGNISSSVY